MISFRSCIPCHLTEEGSGQALVYMCFFYKILHVLVRVQIRSQHKRPNGRLTIISPMKMSLGMIKFSLKFTICLCSWSVFITALQIGCPLLLYTKIFDHPYFSTATRAKLAIEARLQPITASKWRNQVHHQFSFSTP